MINNQDHLKEDWSIETNKCKNCDNTSNNTKSLKRHIRKVQNIDYENDLCEKYLNPIGYLAWGSPRKYLKRFNCINLLPMNSLNICDICNMKVSNECELKEHVKYFFSGVPKLLNILYSCEICKTNFYARYTYGNRNQRGLKIASWNKGGGYLHNKMHEIEKIVEDIQPHILGITEANRFKSHIEKNINIEGYDVYTAKTMDNPNLNVSRVIVYKHKSVVSKLREDLMDDNISSIWMELGFPNKRKILVCNVYREWQYLNQPDDLSKSIPAQLQRWDLFLNQWQRALATGKEVHVIGDINIDHLKWTQQNVNHNDQTYRLRDLIDALFTRIFPLGITQCVKVATRVWPGLEDSGLDHYYTNKPEKLSDIQVQHRAASDHKLIFGVRYTKNIVNNIRYVKKRIYKKFDPVNFVNEVKKIKWWSLYTTEDVNSAVHIFSSKLNEILDRVAPIKTIQIRTNYSPWLSDETKTLMAERNNAQKIASITQTPEDWKKFKSLRNQVNNRLKNEKYCWKKNKLENCNNDSGKLWKNIMGWLKWSSSGSPTKLFYEGKLENKPGNIANIMNNFFINKVKNILKNIPAPVIDPLETLRKLMANRTCQFKLNTVHPDEILDIINSLKNSKSCGLDNIDTYVIKLVKYEILPAITHIVNLSIHTSTFPALYKTAKVIPLLKKGDPLDPKNYRPVAILPIVSKIIERVIFLQTIKYMNENGLLHPNHHGFRPYHSTTTALIQMYDSWIEAVDRGEYTGVCMLDMSAAFDVVSHCLLLQKMALYGFNNNAVKWIESYLQDREQCVYIDGCLSKCLKVETGVPQGSILGPLCYIIFTGDLPEIIHQHGGSDVPQQQQQQQQVHVEYNMHCDDCGGICCYADDSTYSTSSPDQNELTAKLTDKYNLIANYMTSNKLKLNDNKTHLLVMTTSKMRQNRNINVHIITPTEVVEPTSCETLLGNVIHEGLKWCQYILHGNPKPDGSGQKSLINQLNTRLNGLKLICKVASFKTRLMVANGIFMSKLIYVIPLWAGCEKYLINALQIIQNSAARAVTKCNRYTSVKSLLSQCGWMSVYQLGIYHSIVLTYKIIQDRNPIYFNEKLSTSFPYRTRKGKARAINIGPQNKLSLTDNSFRWRASRLWNKLPPDIRTIPKLPQFKSKLKKWILENIDIHP